MCGLRQRGIRESNNAWDGNFISYKVAPVGAAAFGSGMASLVHEVEYVRQIGNE